jgi:hypothetical protein
VAWLRRSGLRAPFHLSGSLLRYGHLTAPQRVSAAGAALLLGRVDPEDPENDWRSFGSWLSHHRQGRQAIDGLWELIGKPTLNLRAGDASLAAAAFVFRTGLLERADAGDIGYARTPLQRVHVGALHDVGSLSGLGSSPILNLHIVYDRRVLDYEFAAAVGSPVQYVFDRTQSSGLDHGQCLAVSISAADGDAETGADELEARFTAALAELLPLARDANVERFVVTREHMATFRAAPGAGRLRPGARTAVPGLALAGAWTDTGWPATMEGAVRSGRAAARVVLPALRRDRAIRGKVAA